MNGSNQNHPSSPCPYCGKEIEGGTTWCTTCGANIRRIGSKNHIPNLWIVLFLVFIPLAAFGGCIVFGSLTQTPGHDYEFVSPSALNGAMFIDVLSFFVGIVLLGYNALSGKK